MILHSRTRSVDVFESSGSRGNLQKVVALNNLNGHYHNKLIERRERATTTSTKA